MAAPAAPDRLTLDVERLTYGPDALGHHGGQVVFVPQAAPGDRVEIEVVERHRSWLRGRVARVDAPGPARVLPGCAAFPRCGGCQWQHVAPTAQRLAKTAVVADQLARVAGLHDAPVLPTQPVGPDWGYRARIALVVEGRRLGYHRARSHVLVEVEDCPIAAPVVSAHLPLARAWAASVRVALARVTIAEAPGGVVLVGGAHGRPGPADVAATEALLARHAALRGAVLIGGGTRVAAGDPQVRVTLEPGLDLELPADVFTQVNPRANQALVALVVAMAAVSPGTRAIDLYCGAGNFALPLARRGARVLGLEHDARAVAAAASNAARLGFGDTAFRADDVAAGLREIPARDVDVAVLDPPRAGATTAALAALVAVRAPRIVYVSCDPATLARDVRTLAAHGWRLMRAQPVDLFPQTYHVETVALLELT